PAPVVATLVKATLDTLAQAEVIRRLGNSGVDVNAAGPDEFRALIEAEIPKWAAVIKAAGVRAD
ncbi:MAG: tripartite tricarboxylate transporter substrate binding protein, partial [Pseudomonadota bacterium]